MILKQNKLSHHREKIDKFSCIIFNTIKSETQVKELEKLVTKHSTKKKRLLSILYKELPEINFKNLKTDNPI